MFDRFSENARKVMGLARKEAGRLNHEYIGTEHILLGLVAESCAATSVLEAMGASVLRVRGAVEDLQNEELTDVLVDRSAATVIGGYAFTPAVKRVIELTYEEAGAGNSKAGTIHLLFGLLREEGATAQALNALGITLDAVREYLKTSSRRTEPAGPAIPAEIELKEGMRVLFTQASGTKNTLEIFVEKGILYVTDRAKDARVCVSVVFRPGVRHAFAVHSWSEPPHPEIETA